jgi:uncharacterized repeat protein (TIGR02543 family)
VLTVPATGTVTLQATEEQGYIFDGWTGTSCSNLGACTITMKGAARTITANFVRSLTVSLSVSGSGSVSSDPSGLDCSDSCSATVRAGRLTLTASGLNPEWTGCTSTSGSVCVVDGSDGGSVSVGVVFLVPDDTITTSPPVPTPTPSSTTTAGEGTGG